MRRYLPAQGPGVCVAAPCPPCPPGCSPPAGVCRPSALGGASAPGRGVVSCPRASRPRSVGGVTGATGATGRNLCFCLRFPSRSSTETASRKNGSLGCRGTRSPSGSAWGRPESGGYGGYRGYVRATRSGPGKPLPSLRSSGRRPVAALISGATARPGRHPCATATAQGPSATATAQGPAASGVTARRGDGVRGPTGPPGALPRSRGPCLPCTLKFYPSEDNRG